jgi:L-asparaginase
MNGHVHAARHVRKASGQRLDAFVSPTLGPIGWIDRSAAGDVVRLVATTTRPPAMRCEALEERIALIAAAIGIDSRPIHDVLDAGARALVIEAFPGGDLTPQMAEGVQRARGAGIPVVVASRGWCADPTDVYAGPGQGAWLREHGVLLARGLSAHKARLLLMVALGAGEEHRLGELLN